MSRRKTYQFDCPVCGATTVFKFDKPTAFSPYCDQCKQRQEPKEETALYKLLAEQINSYYYKDLSVEDVGRIITESKYITKEYLRGEYVNIEDLRRMTFFWDDISKIIIEDTDEEYIVALKMNYQTRRDNPDMPPNIMVLPAPLRRYPVRG